MLSIDDLFTPLDGDTVLATWLTTLETFGVPAKSWRVGGAARSILRVVANTYAGFTILQSDLAKAAFLDSSTGNWLTLLARYVYGVERITATFATGKVTFTNSGGGVYSYAAGAVRVSSTSTGKSYVTTEDLTLGAMGSATIAIEATELGTASNAAPGLIDKLETTMLGVAVGNALAVQASDQEFDEDLRIRCRGKIAGLSPRGPRGAYDYAARSALRGDGSPIGVNRTWIANDLGTGTVNIWCATPAGIVAAPDLPYIVASIEAIARPDTVTVAVASAISTPLSGSLIVWARRTAGWDAPAYTTAIDAVLLAALATYPIGGIAKPPSTDGYLWASFIDGVVKSAHASIFAVDGAADLAITFGHVATFAASLDIRIVDA